MESNLDLQILLHQQRFRWMLNGHTHQRMVRRFGPLININGGKLGRKADSTPTGVWTIDFVALEARFFRFEKNAIVPGVHDKVLLNAL